MAQTVYDPPVATYIPLQTITLGAAASSVTFASIPQTYRDLVLIFTPAVTGGSSSTASSYIRLNGDSGSNYSHVVARGDGSSTGSTSFTDTGIDTRYYTNSPGSLGASITQVQFLDYSATDKHKSVLSRGNTAASGVNMTAARWANTAAITSIQIVAPSGRSWLTGATLSLYGIEA